MGYKGLSRWVDKVHRATARVNSRKIPRFRLSPAEIILGWQTRCVPHQPEVEGASRPLPPSDPTMAELHTASITLREARVGLNEQVLDAVADRPEVVRENPYQLHDWVWEYLPPIRDMKIGAVRRTGPADRTGEDNSRFQKLRPRWRGPLEIVAILSSVSVRVVDAITKRSPRKVHINTIKPYVSNRPEHHHNKKGPSTEGSMGLRERIHLVEEAYEIAEPDKKEHRLSLNIRILSPTRNGG